MDRRPQPSGHSFAPTGYGPQQRFHWSVNHHLGPFSPLLDLPCLQTVFISQRQHDSFLNGDSTHFATQQKRISQRGRVSHHIDNVNL